MMDDKLAVTQDMAEAFELAHALIQEAKGAADGPAGGFIIDHLDFAEHWLDKAERLAAQARLAGERAGMPDVHYDELAIQHGQQVTVTFKDPADAFALFNEIRERRQDAIRKEAASITHPGD